MGSDRNWVHVDFISEVRSMEMSRFFREGNNEFYFGPDELKVFVDIW